MAFNRIPTIYTFLMSLIPSDSNSMEKTGLYLITLKQTEKKKSSAPAPEETFSPYLRPLKKKKWRGTESYYWHLIYNIRKMAALQTPHVEELFILS